MASVNIPYLCTTIGNLSGVPIRLYRGGDLALYHSMVELPRDPLALCREAVFSISDHVGYHVTPQFHYYGVLNAGDVKLVIGPTRQIPESEQELRELAFQLDLSGQQAHAFAEGMRCIVRMPIESIMQMLCAVNHVLNGETLELKDLCVYEQEQTALLHRQETLAPEVERIESVLALKRQDAVESLLQVRDPTAFRIEQETAHPLPVKTVQAVPRAQPDEALTVFADRIDRIVQQAVFHGQQVHVPIEKRMAR